jgi:hypothetical protein
VDGSAVRRRPTRKNLARFLPSLDEVMQEGVLIGVANIGVAREIGLD